MVDAILDRYNLTRETAAKYVNAIVQLNQSEAAEEIGVSRQTVNAYKKAFRRMTAQERLAVISHLSHETLFNNLELDNDDTE